MYNNDTICALATASGIAAISVIRVSGENSFDICNSIFRHKNKSIDCNQLKSHHIYFGTIIENDEIIDEVLLSIFKQPHSYTAENSIEISCHGSSYIQQRILQLIIKNGARIAKPGEFTMRAFLNGKLDLSQAEAVADLIASHSKTSHSLALEQMRGGFSSKIKQLRQELVNFASLIELELDFSEEDVEFANRDELSKLLNNLKTEINSLIQSFAMGNVLKHGIPVAIIGKPNVGKSTLLNSLLNEERAIVSEIPGTTRDTIEDTLTLEGITFRFIDTAGLRDSSDEIEMIGIERTYQKIEQANIILYVVDIKDTTVDEIMQNLKDFELHIRNNSKRIIIIANKTDLLDKAPRHFSDLLEREIIFISAKRKENINLITNSLLKSVATEQTADTTMISNIRHYEALQKTDEAILQIEQAIKLNISGDLIAIDIRTALHHLGEITGEITNDEILGNIFSSFCIGK
ncbi:MAG: tRNA uridine-5-carboxymethylaminomethyl(34) synthesis GTPase MnmE [Bacteroidetes bacterium]|nr:tRNA uridine-5-carboxymethylaminomethyl(34) synthesis GTPase MnmE [Bacteroidota bacterium]